MGIVEEKNALRARLKRARVDLGQEMRSLQDAAIRKQLVSSDAFSEARVVLTYLSMGSEVDTVGIIQAAWKEGKTVAIPRVRPGGRTLDWYVIRDFESLEKSPFGVLEPDPEKSCMYAVNSILPQIALVPGFAFSAAGHRLGYGGGFYDVFLQGFQGRTIGLCRPAFHDDALVPVEPHDVPVETVMTGEQA